MRINTKVRYAIRMMAEIARQEHGERVVLKAVAARQHISRLYLSQLAAPLKTAGLLKSVWGKHGGYTLARPGAEINLLDIIEAVDGPVAVLDCLLDPEYCDRADYCECLGVWREINEAIIKILERHTLAEMIGRSRPVTRLGELCVVDMAVREASHEH